jgi:hypothetical protein
MQFIISSRFKETFIPYEGQNELTVEYLEHIEETLEVKRVELDTHIPRAEYSYKGIRILQFDDLVLHNVAQFHEFILSKINKVDADRLSDEELLARDREFLDRLTNEGEEV